MLALITCRAAASVADGVAFYLTGFANCSRSRYGGVWNPILPPSSSRATLSFLRSLFGFTLETQAGAAAAVRLHCGGRCGEREIFASCPGEAASSKGKQVVKPEKLAPGFPHAPTS